MSFKFAVIGKTGQLARALKTELEDSDDEAIYYGRDDLDLSSDPIDIERFILSLPQNIHAVILAAAYTQVDRAETETDLAFLVNADAPGAIARACKQRGIALIHISTDYVFQGEAKDPYHPESPTDPINAYGASKLAGEKAIFASGCHGAILRTSWVFDGLGKNFLTTMLRLAQTRTALSVVDDQWGRPTYARHLAKAAIKAAQFLSLNETLKMACYHVSGSGPKTHWAGFAQEIFDMAAYHLPHKVTITPIPSTSFPTAAKRPAFSVMDISLFEKRFEHKLPSWKTGLKAALAEKY